MNDSRRREIVNLLTDKKYMSVKDLAQAIFASEPTVRRDLALLEEEGFLKRTHGGASYVTPDKANWPFLFRNKTNMDKKRYIAKLAAEFIEDGDSIFIDSSSTCLCFAQELSENIELNVLTYGIHTAQQLAEYTNSFVECVCGKYHPTRASIYGNDACNFISQHNAKTCFISGCGIDAEHGLTDYSIEETALKRIFHQYSDQTIVLIDSSKINKVFYRKDLNLKEIDIIITDKPLPKEMDDLCFNYNIRVIF